ncbi:MAG TPA: hypothetical protein VIL82_03145 [Solirubrobacteraceae bacterium]
MAIRRKRSLGKAIPFDIADLGRITKANPYIQRLIEDSKLRDNVRTAIDSSKSAYGRLSNGKTPAKALMDDKKLQADLRQAAAAIREASNALSEAPKKSARKGLRLRRKLLVLVLGGAAALAGSEKLRSKVLDTLFGAEEEFQYTPPATPAAAPTESPVTAA